MLLLVLPGRQQTTRQASKQDPYRWLRFLQTLQDVDHFGFLFDVLHFLNDVQARRSGTSYVDGDWLHQRTACKVLNLLGHGGREQQCLTLALQPSNHQCIRYMPTIYKDTRLFIPQWESNVHRNLSNIQPTNNLFQRIREGYMPNHCFCILYSSWFPPTHHPPPKNNSPGKFWSLCLKKTSCNSPQKLVESLQNLASVDDTSTKFANIGGMSAKWYWNVSRICQQWHKLANADDMSKKFANIGGMSAKCYWNVCKITLHNLANAGDTSSKFADMGTLNWSQQLYLLSWCE